MEQFIAFDSHKHYTLASVDRPGRRPREVRIDHVRGALRSFLETHGPGCPVAVETIGNWYWIVDEIEAAGFEPRLVHARKAKVMMGMVNKTDKLDSRGMNVLQRTGTLPTVWIPPGDLRDLRDLPRTRMLLVKQRTQAKNRIQAALAKYALRVEGVSKAFGKKGRELLREEIGKLPPHTAFATEQLLEEVESLDRRIQAFEERMREAFEPTEEVELLQTMPGVGFILSVLIWLEVGDVNRFPRSESLASYSGTVPRVHSSGGKTRHGRVRSDVNRYLKWAYVEAGNSCSAMCKRRPDRHVSRLYRRIRERKGHPKAIVAVGRHLAEATYWILKKKEPYRDPGQGRASSTEA